MALLVRERRFANGNFGWAPAVEGVFPVILVLHDPNPAYAGWCNRDALLFAAHGFAALPVYDDVAAAAKAVRQASFANGRLGVFSVGTGAARVAEVLNHVVPDALALHGPSPVELEPLASFGGALFLSHGTGDEYSPVETSRRLEALVRDRGRDPEVYYYEGLDHGLNDEDAANLNTARFVAFFQRTLCPNL